jgi:ATP-binding cassette subfamily B protein
MLEAGAGTARAAKKKPLRHRSLLENGQWALATTWATNRFLTALLVIVQTVLGALPAGQALVTRGLINAAVTEVRSRGGGLRPILPWLVLTFIVTISEGVLRLLQDFGSRRLEDDLNLELNGKLLTHAAGLDVSFFEDPASEDMLYLAKQNTARSMLLFVNGTLSLFSNLLQMISLLAVLVAIEPWVLALTPCALPYVWFQWRLSEIKHQLETLRATKRRWTQYFVSALTDASWVPEIKILDLAALLIGKFRAFMTEFRDQDGRLLVRSLRAAVLFSSFATIALFALFAKVALRVIRGSSTLGDLAIFGVAAGRLRATLENEVTAIAGIREEALNVSDLRQLLVARAGIVAGAGSRAPGVVRGEIQFDRVSFTYPGSATPTLRDLSLTIRAGETLALVGRNGSGKSTLTKLIARFYDPTIGCVRLDGQDLRKLDPDELRSHLAFVFQNFGRYEASVADNIGYGDWRRLVGQNGAVKELAAEAGLDDMMGALPDGVETIVGRKFGRFDLSAGQWQRVAVARAFARRTPIVILDEPSSNLDPIAERELASHFRTLVKGRTAIVISHRWSTIRLADRIAVIQDGRIVESGTHDELQKKGGHYADLYQGVSSLER